MPQISGTNERFLQAPVILSEIMRVLEPALAFLDVIPFVDSGGVPFSYGVKNSRAGDAKKQIARLRTPSSRFAEVEITRMTKKTALTVQQGLQIRLDEAALRLPAGRDMIMDAFQSVGYWLAEALNVSIYTTIRAGGTDAGMTPTAVWSAANATPFEDLRNFKNGMKRDGYPYRMTDAYVEMTNYNELEGYLANVDITDAQRTLIYGKPTINQDTISIPLVGDVHGLFSGMTHGDILGLDRRNPASSVFYYNDPKYSTGSITYDTVINGAQAPKTVPNFGLNTHQYFEDATHDTIIQVWFDTVTVVKDAYSIIYDNGL